MKTLKLSVLLLAFLLASCESGLPTEPPPPPPPPDPPCRLEDPRPECEDYVRWSEYAGDWSDAQADQ